MIAHTVVHVASSVPVGICLYTWRNGKGARARATRVDSGIKTNMYTLNINIITLLTFVSWIIMCAWILCVCGLRESYI